MSRAYPESPIDIVCSHCGSRDVRRDADATWNAGHQAWELCAVYDQAHCEQCGGETSLSEIPLSDEAQPGDVRLQPEDIGILPDDPDPTGGS